MLMAIFFAVLMLGVAILLLWAGSKAWQHFREGLAQASGEKPASASREMVPRRASVQADGLIYLFAERFVRPPTPGKPTNPRLRATDPISDAELDPRDWACKLLFALLADQHEHGAIQFSVEDRTPTLMPPFPHKNWELHVRRVRTLSNSPLGDCLGVAFDMVEKRSRAQSGEEQPTAHEPQWHPMELVIEKMLNVVRAETGFWQREGVYGDLRNYVAESLVADGYLTEATSNTWVEHFRRRRMVPSLAAVEPLEAEAEALRNRLRTLRRRFGSAEFLGDDEPDTTYTHLNTPATLTSVEDVRQVLWADALGITIFETLVALRQLEPTGDGSG